MSNEKIESIVKHHTLNDEQEKIVSEFREKIKELLDFIDHELTNSREKSLAQTKLEECMFWGNACISRH